jgi:hypothetical protein
MPNDKWKTPNTEDHPIIDLISMVLGQIDLDPTADDAKKNIPALRHYNREDDSLRPESQWLGTVYMNPPFSKPMPFVAKLCAEMVQGRTSEAIILVKSGVLHNKGTGSLIREFSNAACLWGAGLSRRIAFLDENDNAVPGADFDCSLVYFGHDQEKFCRVFSHFGICVSMDNTK